MATASAGSDIELIQASSLVSSYPFFYRELYVTLAELQASRVLTARQMGFSFSSESLYENPLLLEFIVDFVSKMARIGCGNDLLIVVERRHYPKAAWLRDRRRPSERCLVIQLKPLMSGQTYHFKNLKNRHTFLIISRVRSLALFAGCFMEYML